MLEQKTFEELRQTPFAQVLDKCIFIRKVSNSLYGDGEVMLHKQFNIQLLLVTRIYNRQEQLHKLVDQAKQRLKIVSPLVIRMISFNVKEIQELCGTFYRFQAFFEYASTTLLDDITSRQQKQQYYSESEICSILRAVLSALSSFKMFSIRHGYIQPKHIVFVKKQVALTDIRFMAQTCEFQQQAIQPLTECFLSPEQLHELVRGGKESDSNYEKSEIFSIGVTLLFCMNLQYPAVCSVNNSRIQNIQPHLRDALSKYQIAKTVSSMLSEDLYSRPSLEELVQMSSKSPILVIDKSKENLDDTVKLVKSIPSEYPTIKRHQQLTPVTHNSKSPFKFCEGEYHSQITIDRDSTGYSRQNSQRQTTPEQRTRPCKSPLRSLNEVSQAKTSYTAFPMYTSSEMSMGSNNKGIAGKPNSNTISYDFAQSIKLDAPASLQQQFSRLKSQYSTLSEQFY